MATVSWFTKEEDWLLKRPIIFNKNLVKLTFIEVGRLLRLLGRLDGNRLLDLCCGIGRHSLEFARHGFQVTGVDITRAYLDIAAANAQKQDQSIEFVHSDMKDFCRKESFDVIVNLCTSFGYFDEIDDDIQVLRNIYQSLAKKGKFVIEILGKEVIASAFRPVEELEFEGYKVRAISRILDDWSRLECRRIITRNGLESEIVAYHRLYSATELRTHLTKTGFTNIRVYGDFAGSPYDNEAKSMIMIAEK
jgi:SAM-dependent methyltransferase